MKEIISLCVLLLLALAVLPACTPEQDDTGIVARVNGRPITLERLQVRYDFKKLAVASETPSVAGLKKEYGGILADILMEELVAQDLESLDLAVTDEELQAAEDEVRADYPEGAFEAVLVEEYIDLDSWRQELRGRLTMEKFFREVLRPGITIGYQEAEAYYREHIQDFYLPEREHFYLVTSRGRDAIESALENLRKGEAIEDQPARFDRVNVRELRVRVDQLTVTWKNALKGLAPGEASSVLTAKGGYEALVYVGPIAAKVLSPTQAYPVVERELLDAKLHEAFNLWLNDALAAATISVTPHLPIMMEKLEQNSAVSAEVEEPESGAAPEAANATQAQ